MKWSPKSSKGKKEIPTFYQYFTETQNVENPSELSEELLSFLFDCFTKIVVTEINNTVRQMVEEGKMTEEQLMSELSPLLDAMASNDKEKSMELMSALGKKYSMTINLLVTEAEGAPNDISSLFT
jgi:hypothetical protein